MKTKSNSKYRIEKIGLTVPIVTFIFWVHGDEKSPIRGTDLLKEYLQNFKLKRGFRIIYVNDKAIAKNCRYLEMDLNRSFPGRKNGTTEEKLAYRLTRELSRTEYNFDFHSSKFKISPYGIISIYSKKIENLLGSIGVNNNVFDNNESLIKFAPNGVAFEVGKEGEVKTAKSAFLIMRRILEYFNIIPLENNKNKRNNKEVKILLVYYFIKKKELSSLDSSLKDFKYLKKGGLIGYLKNGQKLLAQEGFYPLLVNNPTLFLKAKRIFIQE